MIAVATGCVEVAVGDVAGGSHQAAQGQVE